MKLYPLKFQPIPKTKIWGGQKLNTVLNKGFSKEELIGESWEISGVEGNISVVSNGYLKGRSLDSIISEFKDKLLGKEVYDKFKNQFPLLIKFIDASENLSVQVHPDDSLAKKRHNCSGKTELWYILEAEDNCEVIAGLKENISKDEYLEAISTNSIYDILNINKIQKDDIIYIPAGKVHAICKGTLLVEIQQSSDITYRIYDWDRQDIDGNKRELHRNLAFDAIKFHKNGDIPKINTKCEIRDNIIDSDYFKINKITLTKYKQIYYPNNNSFKIFICLKGEGIIKTDNYETTIKSGDCFLIPSNLNNISISSDKIELLEVRY
ncbi:MAG: class I mannose-6-phosphate isomerase [Marinifilaceae bacterium]|jgi:mannose-6-phosphate isomerase|nr:class I mannose-6-phosphate isomerase [Marinifilaceae bacterium]